jgi:topoisomerase-4 subunit A
VHRRLLRAMRLLKLRSSERLSKKCARVVGTSSVNNITRIGDQSVYDAMVRLAQTFSLRLSIGRWPRQFGNIDGDNAAAYRYTSAGWTKTAPELMNGLDENATDFSAHVQWRR